MQVSDCRSRVRDGKLTSTDADSKIVVKSALVPSSLPRPAPNTVVPRIIRRLRSKQPCACTTSGASAYVPDCTDLETQEVTEMGFGTSSRLDLFLKGHPTHEHFQKHTFLNTNMALNEPSQATVNEPSLLRPRLGQRCFRTSWRTRSKRP